MYYPERDALRREQRKLIPVNIVVALLSLVAAFSILLLPLLRIEIDDLSALMADGSSVDVEQENSPADMLDGLEVTFSLSGMDFAQLGFSDSPDDVLLGRVGEAFSALSGELASRVLLTMAAGSSDAVTETSAQSVIDALATLESAQDDAEVDAAISSLADILGQYAGGNDGWDAGQVQTHLRELYDDTVAETGGSFSAEAFICVQISSANAEEGGTGEIYTSFAQLLANMETDAESLESSLPENSLLYAGAAVLFFAAVWAVLFLFAFFHLFAKNKRFTMWYVKLFGAFPCLIFGVAPLIAGQFIQDASAAAVFGMMSSLSWVSGACYVLLWLVSVFWAFPIKRKIRKLNKQLSNQ